MTIKPLLFLLGFSCLYLTSFAHAATVAATAPEVLTRTLSIEARNPLNTARQGAATLIPLVLLHPLIGAQFDAPVLTQIDGRSLGNQIVDSDKDGTADALLVLVDYASRQSIQIDISVPSYGKLALGYSPLTQAEMAMRMGGKLTAEGVHTGGNYYPVQQMDLPPSHKIGDKLFKYEGFGWESDLVAYRFYFDERGLVDIFGKRIPDLVLARVGLDDGDYHALSDWGMDVLKVGPSLGMGGVAAWREGKVQHPAPTTQSVELRNGALESSALLKQSGWGLGDKTLELTRQFSIRAHSHLTHTHVTTDQSLGELAIGIVKHGVARLEYLQPDSEWNYLATFGKQSLANDALGMVIFFRHRDLQKTLSDEFNELAILKMNTRMDYYFGARWEGEAEPLRTGKEYLAYLERMRAELNNPITVNLIKKAN